MSIILWAVHNSTPMRCCFKPLWNHSVTACSPLWTKSDKPLAPLVCDGNRVFRCLLLNRAAWLAYSSLLAISLLTSLLLELVSITTLPWWEKTWARSPSPSTPVKPPRIPVCLSFSLVCQLAQISQTHTPLPMLSAHVEGKLPNTAHLFMSNPTTAKWAQLWCSMSRLPDRAGVTSLCPFWGKTLPASLSVEALVTSCWLRVAASFCCQQEKSNPEIARFRHPQLNKSIN